MKKEKRKKASSAAHNRNTEQTGVRKRLVVAGFLLVLLTVLLYLPTLRAKYIWDDHDYVVENTYIRNVEGLKRIWLEPGLVPQYYPLVFTLFTLEYRLWGLDPAGYHGVNILLHAGNVVLLWVLLRRLKVPCAWLAAAIFAIHPVHVASVAWIAERKNVLSEFFYLLSMLTYLRFTFGRGENEKEGNRRWGLYFAAVLLFIGALLSKTVTLTLPAALLLILWWKKEKIAWKDVLPLIPMVILGLIAAGVTSWVEKITCLPPQNHFSIFQRLLLAGQALWFYWAGLLFPVDLCPVYPHWNIQDAAWWRYLFVAGVFGVVFALWILRKRIGKGPITALLFFVVSILPVLGFIDFGYMGHSYVADHFQYLPSIGIIALFVAAGTYFFRRLGLLGKKIGSLVVVLVVISLGVLTWRQEAVYQNTEDFYQTAIRKNPEWWTGYSDLGILRCMQGRFEDGLGYFQKANDIRPQNAKITFNMGLALENLNRYAEAEMAYKQSIQADPTRMNSYFGVVKTLCRQGKYDEAAPYIQKVRELAETTGQGEVGRAFEAWFEARKAGRRNQPDLSK